MRESGSRKRSPPPRGEEERLGHTLWHQRRRASRNPLAHSPDAGSASPRARRRPPPQKRARRAHVRHGLGGPLLLAVVDAGPRAGSRPLSRVCDAAAQSVDARIVRGTHPHAAQEERRQRPHRRRRRSSSGLANRREEQRGGPTHRELRRRTGRGERPRRSSGVEVREVGGGCVARGGGCWVGDRGEEEEERGPGRRGEEEEQRGPGSPSAPRAPRAARRARSRGGSRCAARARAARRRNGGRVAEARRRSRAGRGAVSPSERAARATKQDDRASRRERRATRARARARREEERGPGRRAAPRARGEEEQEPSAPRARGVSRGQAARARAA